MAGLKQLNWASEGVGATAAALVDLSTVAGNKISNPPWVKFQSAGWVNFPSAPTPNNSASTPALDSPANEVEFFGELLEITCEEKLVEGEQVGAELDEELALED
ncbi:hypothetical protein [Stutzerimonas stutzeri]|uniref:hypothetical protein n=1 Tax=Stutzerimonas stutzeri TaxID=316 RepID=UPI00190E2B3D|nr:hypothetical protein [Stutzerimonas stutzeri]MBK3807411.1 hypothetical protein [Stutzerimonas stutzeri]MBK3851822.1 hypothetical protein [Stutzerimonas stutzeri]